MGSILERPLNLEGDHFPQDIARGTHMHKALDLQHMAWIGSRRSSCLGQVRVPGGRRTPGPQGGAGCPGRVS